MAATTDYSADSFLAELRRLYVQRYREEGAAFHVSENLGLALRPEYLTDQRWLAKWMEQFGSTKSRLAEEADSELQRVAEIDVAADRFYKQAAVDVKKTLEKDELIRVEGVVVGEIPLSEVNATVFSLPAGEYLVAINRALNDMLLQYNSIYLKFLLDVERDLRAGRASDTAWDFLVDVQAGKINPYGWIRENKGKDFFARKLFPLWFIQTCFIVAHEFGHIVKGHVGRRSMRDVALQMGKGSKRTVRIHVQDHDQEREADAFAWTLMGRMFGSGELGDWRKPAVANLFSYLEYVERVMCVSRHVGRVLEEDPEGIPVDFGEIALVYESKTHPRAQTRRELLRARFGEITPDEESLIEGGELCMIGLWDAFVETQQKRGWLTGVGDQEDREWEIRRGQAQTHIDAATRCLEGGDLGGAIAAYRSAVELDPYHPTAFGILGKLLMLEDATLAMTHLRRARLLRDAYELLGTINVPADSVQRAIEILEQQHTGSGDE